MFHTYCGGCSNRVDPSTAVVWKRPKDGKYLYFCSEECRLVGENIEPPDAWSPLGSESGEAGCGRLPPAAEAAAARKHEPARAVGRAL